MNARRQLPDHPAAIEARLAARLSAGLAERSEQLPHDIRERLRVAREQAVERAALARRKAPETRTASEVAVVGVSAHGVALLGETVPWWQRVASLLPLLVLLCGLVLIQQHAETERVQAAAEVDALLLADELPPDAYSDPGFAAYLREPAP